MEVKLCAFCKNFNYTQPEEVWLSEITSETYGGASCKENVFFSDRFTDAVDMRYMLLRAENCSKYIPVTD